MRERFALYAKRNKQHDTRSTEFLGHRLAVCHGDLGPKNILILADGQVALLDWEWMCIYPANFRSGLLFYARHGVPTLETKISHRGLEIGCLSCDIKE